MFFRSPLPCVAADMWHTRDGMYIDQGRRSFLCSKIYICSMQTPAYVVQCKDVRFWVVVQLKMCLVVQGRLVHTVLLSGQLPCTKCKIGLDPSVAPAW